MKSNNNTPTIRFAGFADPWERRKLGEVTAEFKSGDYICAKFITENGLFPVYGGNGIRGYTDIYNYDGEYALVGRQGALCGNVKKSNGRAYFTEHAIAVQANNENSTDFLYHLLSISNLGQYSDQSAQPGLAVGKLVNICANFPAIIEQQRIASLYNKLDFLIEHYQRKYEKLVNLKKAMLDKMFPKNGELVPEVRFAGFSSNWERHKLGEMAQFNPKEVVPNEFEYVDLESVVGTEMLSHRRETKRSAPSRAQRVAHVGDLFYQTVRPYQKNNYLFEIEDGDYVFSTGYAQMRPSVDGYFLLSVILHDKFVNAVLNMCIGTGYPAVNSKDLAKIELCAPTQLAEQQIIGRYFRMLDKLTNLQQRKLAKLQKLKSAFLEKMFV